MIRPIWLLATTALITLAGCSDDKAETGEQGSSISIDLDDSDGRATAVASDGGNDSVALDLPGGIAANLKLPAGAIKGESFDIDGVGMYPGAVVRSVKVNASDRGPDKRATVAIGFTAPGDAAAVADWYQKQFEDKALRVTRSGDTVSGRKADGDDFTIAVTGEGGGQARGLVTIVDAKRG
ncbi:hypothetical protein [Polymorphobacter fuscus]|uniref:Uncharacterized protein n=1 Tax=Sandarakinorhabdus fusca TaxID=1439888 RepID=A0A7C9KHV0_9SPHN|nr:hypothetical protein [Polymorphobacter fuscus]KAB7647463.1 hypothetical protein F9290_05535 [Polymorphobacter fuscus]MQT16719.1 hypothetical protein [Polymorphobacter fuscus]NJC09294.1 hypothetical protein [Polymorphobacter fuscus]